LITKAAFPVQGPFPAFEAGAEAPVKGAAAFEANAATLPLGSVGFEARLYSDVILRLAETTLPRGSVACAPK
jgi:hypothetical protein